MPFLSFLSDYGYEDHFVGVCHGVVARVAPGVRVIDVTHGIPRHDVRAGALTLDRALAHLPVGVHVAVVDPGVGGTRRSVALVCADDGQILVGPDNGLLLPAAQRLGGVLEAYDIGHSALRLTPVSATFHGRDVFLPVAASLAAGAPLAAAGDPVDAAELVVLELPDARVGEERVLAHVLLADRFGNVLLNVSHDDLAGSGLRLGRAVTVNGRAARFVTTFADVAPGELLLYEDADQMLALAVNRGSALDELGLRRDDEVHLAAALVPAE